jgi:hypothetical protein
MKEASPGFLEKPGAALSADSDPGLEEGAALLQGGGKFNKRNISLLIWREIAHMLKRTDCKPAGAYPGEGAGQMAENEPGAPPPNGKESSWKSRFPG